MLSSPFPLLVLLAYAVAVLVAVHLGDAQRWRAALTDRLYLGVPWGTLGTIAFVLSVYLFVQGGLGNWYDPVVVPFRAWSYLYPTGMLTAGFSHHSAGHLIGNLIGTIALAPLVEYAWGHYPGGSKSSTDGGSAATRSRASASRPLAEATGPRQRLHDARDRALQTPWIRAFVLFPLAAVLVGLFTAVFAVGPVIGFSGVVFAFGGFAIVRYPVGTVVALFVSSVLSTTYYAIRGPVVYAEISGSAPSPPGWATVAVQGHALGIVLGVLLGLALLHARGVRPNVARVLGAMVIYGMTQRLWAIYWFEGNGVYVLYRALGVSLVVFLGVTVAVAASASDRPVPGTLADLPGSPTGRQAAAGWLGLLAVATTLTSLLTVLLGWPTVPTLAVTAALAVGLALPAIWALSPIELDELPTSRQTAAGALLAALILISVPAMLPNLVTVGDDPVPNEQAIHVEGYSVTYAENVRDRMIPAIDLPLVADRTTVPTSGVIVVNEDRNIWTSVQSKQYLASEGHTAVTVGGVGWRETVHVDRDGWTLAGNETAYAIDLSHDGETVRAFRSGPKRATLVLANHTVAVVPADDRFRLRVLRNNRTVDETAIPSIGNASSAGPLTFETVRLDDRVTVLGSVDGTRVPIAQRETYREE